MVDCGRGVGSMGAMGAWAPINISSGVTNGLSTLYYKDRVTVIE